MRLAFLTDRHPVPPEDGSSVVAFAWIDALARRGHDIALAAAAAVPKKGASGMDRSLNGVALDLGAPVRRSPLSAVPLLLRGQPIHVARFGGGWAGRCLDAMARHGFEPEAVVLVGAGLAGALPELQRGRWADLPAVHVPCDCVSAAIRDRLPLAGPIRSARLVVAARAWERSESRLFPLADASVVVTPAEADRLRRIWRDDGDTRVEVLPNGVDTDYFSPDSNGAADAAEDAETVIITGNMWASHTLVSVRWFAEEVWPRIRRSAPGAECRLVGKSPRPELRALAGRTPGLRLVGTVPDLRPHIARATVYVAPMKVAAGIKNRVLEGLAMARPVVLTPEAAGGLALEPGRDFLLGGTAAEFADHVLDLFRSPTWRHELGQRGRAGVEAHHSWQSVAAAVERLVSELRSRSLAVGT